MTVTVAGETLNVKSGLGGCGWDPEPPPEPHPVRMRAKKKDRKR
jgi:hypothetical protein